MTHFPRVLRFCKYMVVRIARTFMFYCVSLAIVASAQTFTRLASLADGNGSNPIILVQGTDGNFYGVCANSDENSSVIFKMMPTGALSAVYTFGSFAGAYSLIAGKDGNLYGVSYGDGNPYKNLPGIDVVGNEGTVFKLTPQGTLTRVFLFDGSGDGGTNENSLSLGADGNFYGTSQQGGQNISDALTGFGTIFRVTPGGTENVLYTFGSFANPSSVILASDGSLYGTTASGGSGPCQGGCGTIFKIVSQSSFETLYSFTGSTDGADPVAALVEGSDGNLYGTAQSMGQNGSGTIFKITRTGAFTVLHSFSGTDGAGPTTLMLGADGNFYGVTSGGGSNATSTLAPGTVYKMTPAGALTTLYNFCSQPNCTDGQKPLWLIQGNDGNLYGVTNTGGAYTTGAVFELQLAQPPALAGASAVTNGASFAAGTIAPGEIATVFATNLTSLTGINETSGLPLPTQFQNVSVTVNGTAAPIFAVDNVGGQQQINFQVPWSVAPKSTASIAVVNNIGASSTVMVPVVAAQPGIIEYNSGGKNFGVILHANYQLADTGHPASPGEVMLIYCTGLGEVSNPPADGAAGSGQDTFAKPTVTIGGQTGAVQFSGLAPGFVGLNQVNVQLPSTLKSGTQAVVLKIDGASSNSVLLPVK